MLHVTCLAHGLNRVAEEVRNQFPLVNGLISNGKKVFVKAPHRIREFKHRYPDTPLPPEPVITRWGTWLDAAARYYVDHFEKLREIVASFDPQDSAAIAVCL